MGAPAALEPLSPVTLGSRLAIGMRHLTAMGLSEQWLLRECGDRHWQLIANAMGLARAVFRGPDGRPAYAAFCATSVELQSLGAEALGASAHLASSLHAVSPVQLGSVHLLECEGRVVARLSMISIFVSHDGSGLNRAIRRNQPLIDLCLPVAPAGIEALAQAARSIARGLRDGGPQGPLVHSETPPPTDFNAVGLLYFPSFTRIAQSAEAKTRVANLPIARRDVVYLGNVDPGERLFVHRADRALVMRRGDDKPVAWILTSRDGQGF